MSEQELVVEPVTEPQDTTALDVRRQLPAQRLTADGVQDLIEQAQLLETLRRACVAMTSQKHWVDFNGAPYLMGTGGYAIANARGLSLSEPLDEFKELGNGHWQCVVLVSVSMHGRSVTDIGDCDSFDSSLVGKKNELQKVGATPEQCLDVLRVEGKKKAIANAVSRAVSAWMGLRGLSWEDLERFGLKRGAGGRVAFQVGSKGGKSAGKLSIAELLALPKGSRGELMATVKSGIQRQGAKGPYCIISVSDSTGEVDLKYWSAKPDWLKANAGLYAKIEVGEFRGEIQLVAHELEQLGTEEATNERPTASDGADDQYTERPNDPEAF